LKEKIQAVMARHYDHQSEALDLSRLHADPDERVVMYNTQRMLIPTIDTEV
jgi:hypothetical protein